MARLQETGWPMEQVSGWPDSGQPCGSGSFPTLESSHLPWEEVLFHKEMRVQLPASQLLDVPKVGAKMGLKNTGKIGE